MRNPGLDFYWYENRREKVIWQSDLNRRAGITRQRKKIPADDGGQAALLEELGIIKPAITLDPLIKKRLAENGRILAINATNLASGALEIETKKPLPVRVKASDGGDVGMELKTKSFISLTLDIGQDCNDMHHTQMELNKFLWLGAITATQIQSESELERQRASFNKKRDRKTLGYGLSACAGLVVESIAANPASFSLALGGLAAVLGSSMGIALSGTQKFNDVILDQNQQQADELAKKRPVFSIDERPQP